MARFGLARWAKVGPGEVRQGEVKLNRLWLGMAGRGWVWYGGAR